MNGEISLLAKTIAARPTPGRPLAGGSSKFAKGQRGKKQQGFCHTELYRLSVTRQGESSWDAQHRKAITLLPRGHDAGDEVLEFVPAAMKLAAWLER